MKRPPTCNLILTLLLLLATVAPRSSAAAVATQVSAGAEHTCAVNGSGGLECWGQNASGEVGDGTQDTRTTPVGVVGLSSGVASVSAGRRFTCAVTSLGGAKCWGRDDHGQLGESSTDGVSPTPVDVVGLTSGVATVAAGADHACAVTTTGGVKCWGRDDHGQLGDGSTGGVSSTPVDVVGLASGVVAITVGAAHSCALTGAGGVKCWGYNLDGGLGDGTLTSSNVPVDVAGLVSGVAAIDAAGTEGLGQFSAATCALTSAGGLKCWGDGLGSTPVDLPGLTSDVAAFSIGGDTFGLAVTTSGGVKRFVQSVTTPDVTQVIGLEDGIDAVAEGLGHRCALTGAGEVRCWGNSFSAALGEGTSVGTLNQHFVPGCVVGFGNSDIDRICDLADPCTAGASFIASRNPRLTLKRVGADPTPDNDGLDLRVRFALPAGVAFADLDPAAEGARLTLVDPSGIVIDRTLPAASYGGRGTAGWFVNGAGTVWRFIDATTSPVNVRATITDQSKGVVGGEVGVVITRMRETVPSSDLPLQAIFVLGGAAAGSTGRCAQSDYQLQNSGLNTPPDCVFNRAQTTLTCRIRGDVE